MSRCPNISLLVDRAVIITQQMCTHKNLNKDLINIGEQCFTLTFVKMSRANGVCRLETMAAVTSSRPPWRQNGKGREGAKVRSKGCRAILLSNRHLPGFTKLTVYLLFQFCSVGAKRVEAESWSSSRVSSR